MCVSIWFVSMDYYVGIGLYACVLCVGLRVGVCACVRVCVAVGCARMWCACTE